MYNACGPSPIDIEPLIFDWGERMLAVFPCPFSYHSLSLGYIQYNTIGHKWDRRDCIYIYVCT